MKQQSVKTICKELFWELAGSFFIAIGLYNFAVAAQLPLTGFSGIAFLLNYIFDVPIGWTIIILNIPVALLCYKTLGKAFFIRSIRCMIVSSLIIDYIAPLFPVYTGSRLLAALATGIVAGFGYAMIYVRNSSTGGLDFIIMAIKAWKPYIPLGKITFGLDVLVIAISGFVLRDVDSVMYGLIVSYLLSIVVDRAIFNINSGKLAIVITEYGSLISQAIEDTCHRGSTILQGAGGYQGAKKQVVISACNTKQMVEIQQAVKEVDPASFLIILESNEVHGDGFRTVRFGTVSQDSEKNA